MSRNLPTEPELHLSRAGRDAALQIWVEHHSLPADLRALLHAIVTGDQGKALRRRLEIDTGELKRLEDAFEHTFAQSVYLVAGDIIEEAYQSPSP